MPSSVLLVLVGLIAGAILPAGSFQVTPELVLLVLVPGLVFEAALRVELDDLRETLGAMVLLAAPGVLISAAVVAVVLQVATGLPLELGMVVGAMVAATDPVAVIATFRNVGAPQRLRTLVEGESLLNDGTALVLFSVTVAAIAEGVSLAETGRVVVISVVGSIVIGLAAGWLASRLIRLVNHHSIELAISLAAAYGTYLLTDRLEASGIIATVVAGVVIGTYGRAVGFSPKALETMDAVWELMAFVLTAFAFLLVGLAISFARSRGGGAVDRVGPRCDPRRAGAGRVRPARRHGARSSASGGISPAVPLGWLHVLFWAGLRGAVAVAMALSLPATSPQRALLQEITFGIVLFTLFVQGTTAEPVVARVGAGRRRPRPAVGPLGPAA